jgi:proteasome assembly chaperone (PAC2) family protein
MCTSKKQMAIRTVGYIHDPKAAKEWFEIYMSTLKSKMLKKHSESQD